MSSIQMNIPFMYKVDLNDIQASLDQIYKEHEYDLDPDEIVIESEEPITVVFDYPLREQVMFDIFPPEGYLTRAELALEIICIYREIYQEEAATTQIPIVPLDERVGLSNRNETDGEYGIWGHDLSDLSLDALWQSGCKDGLCELNQDPATGYWNLIISS